MEGRRRTDEGGEMGLGDLGENCRGEFYLRSKYRLGKRIGMGTFSKVIVASHELTGQKVAIKILNREKIRCMGDHMEEMVRREIKMCLEFFRLFSHPHVARVYEVISTPTDIFVVMEYMKCGDLFDYITLKVDRLHEDEARRYFQQIVSGVDHLHRNMVVHRDLKPENLLLDAGNCNVKIADFGFCSIMRDGHCFKTMCGTPNYAAPELLAEKWYPGPEVDVWSCGVILYALLCSKLPFDDASIPNLFRRIKAGEYTLPSHLSLGARDLISRILRVDPLQRLTIPEIRQHQWFQARLPRYLAVRCLQCTNQQAKKIDQHILHTLITHAGFSRNGLIESLREGVQNQETVAYYLKLDNSVRISHGYLGEDIEEPGREEPVAPGSAHIPTHIMGFVIQREAMGIPPGAGLGFTPRALNHPVSLSPSGGFQAALPHMVHPERRWVLGLECEAPPRQIMMTVLRSLHVLGISWKNQGSYCLKCRWMPPGMAPVVAIPRGNRRMPPVAAIPRGDRRMPPVAAMLRDNRRMPPVARMAAIRRDSSRPSTSYSPMEPGLIGSLPNGFANSHMLSRSSPSELQVQHERQMITSAALSPGESSEGPSSLGHGSEDHHGVVKFEVQLYKVTRGKYIIDLQRAEGSHFVFLDLCASFRSQFWIPQMPRRASREGMGDGAPLQE